VLTEWRRRWQLSVSRWPERPALISSRGVMRFADLDAEAQRHRRQFERQDTWRVGRCLAFPWSDPWTDLPRLIGLWLAGGSWIAHAQGGDRSALAQELAAAVNGPEAGDGVWQSLLFSSGSTAQPKVLVRGWPQALAEADAYADLMALPAGARTAVLVNPWFGACTKQLLAGLLRGWSQTLGAAELEVIGHGGDLLYATPSQLQALGPPPPDSGGFGWISLTGEACPAALWPLLRRWGRPQAALLNALGASETGVIANQVLPLAADWRPFVGELARGKQVALLDEQGAVLHREGAIGRLRVRGPALMEGQLLRQAQGWTLQPLEHSADGMELLSHDLARWDGQGRLEWLGRSNQLLKRHGEWIDAAPLQQLLERQPGVRRCQLFGESEGLVVWLQVDTPASPWLEALALILERELADPRLLPQRLCALCAMPQNTNGKLDLAALQAAHTDPGRLGGVGWSPPAQARTLATLPPVGLALDSLDQAQLLAQLQPINLLWCGPGHRQVAAACRPGVGVVGLPFPRVPLDWRVGQGPGLRTEALALMEALLQLTGQRLGHGIWLGGFSTSAWLAHDLAQLLQQQGQPVRGVILLDPVDPFSGTYRWPWRRWLANRWRRGSGIVFYRKLPRQRLLQKAWTQELLGRWQPDPLSAEVLVIRSRWRQRLSRRRIVALQPGARVLELPCCRHEEVFTDPQAMTLWQGWMREVLGSGNSDGLL
jgi:thioesterase domain-containing protein